MAQPQKINGSNVLTLFRLQKNAATEKAAIINFQTSFCLLYTSPSPRD